MKWEFCDFPYPQIRGSTPNSTDYPYAGNRNRTCDLRVTSALLYRLSYSSRIKYCFRLRLLETLLFLKEQHMVEILRISLATDSKQCFELYRLSYSSRIKYCFRLRLLETLLFLKEQHIVKILRISLATDSKQCFQTLPFYFTQKLAV